MIVDSPLFVVGFAPGPGGRLRAEVVMRASDRRHASLLATGLADDDGAIVQAQVYSGQDAIGEVLRHEAGNGRRNRNMYARIELLPN
jgi:hypothetical protein